MVPFKCERTFVASRIEDFREKIREVRRWMGGPSASCYWRFWGLDRLSGFPVIHNVLEVKSEYFSMDFVICPERVTHNRIPSLVVRMAAHAVGRRKS